MQRNTHAGDAGAAYAFLLGTERSGSTWLANILDSHPAVELFMEPFAEYASLFPGFPSRSQYLEQANPELLKRLRTDFDQLYRKKHPFLYRPSLPLQLKNFDRCLVSLTRRTIARFSNRLSLPLRRYECLNLNTRDIPTRLQTRKTPSPALLLTKELRLNLKVRLLSKAFPGARYIVILRHPGVQIASIKRLFQAGSLTELKRSLPDFEKALASSQRFNRYRNVSRETARRPDIDTSLALWWLVQNEILLEDLQRSHAPAHIARHEDLCADPSRESSKICEFLDLSPSSCIDDFIQASSKQTGSGSEVDTFRESSTFCNKSFQTLDPNMMRKIADTLGSVDIRDELKPYRDSCRASQSSDR
ncbi:MAG TPA: hypothetical protein DCM05_11930 [Elusimicrobia bacterium]|nr:hypothetical protein [Elusimicrobiota bacterium]